MVRVQRAMTPIGLAMASGKEIQSITYGHTHARSPNPHPPVSFRGEWGELQREARHGAIVGRAKTTSNDTTWSNIAHKLSHHRRPLFQKRKCPLQTLQTPLLKPNLSRRRKGTTAPKSKDLQTWLSLEHFVTFSLNEINRCTNISTEHPIIKNEEPQPTPDPHTVNHHINNPAPFDCCVEFNLIQNRLDSVFDPWMIHAAEEKEQDETTTISSNLSANSLGESVLFDLLTNAEITYQTNHSNMNNAIYQNTPNPQPILCSINNPTTVDCYIEFSNIERHFDAVFDPWIAHAAVDNEITTAISDDLSINSLGETILLDLLKDAEFTFQEDFHREKEYNTIARSLLNDTNFNSNQKIYLPANIIPKKLSPLATPFTPPKRIPAAAPKQKTTSGKLEYD